MLIHPDANQTDSLQAVDESPGRRRVALAVFFQSLYLQWVVRILAYSYPYSFCHLVWRGQWPRRTLPVRRKFSKLQGRSDDISLWRGQWPRLRRKSRALNTSLAETNSFVCFRLSQFFMDKYYFWCRIHFEVVSTLSNVFGKRRRCTAEHQDIFQCSRNAD